MSSNGDRPGGGSTSSSALVDESTRRLRRTGNRARPAVGGGHEVLRADLTPAIAAMRQVQQEFDDLWHAAVVAGDGAFAEQLVDVSHALRRAASLLEKKSAIG
jgi:hypothetical protein